MKAAIKLLCFLVFISTNKTSAQTIEGFFRYKGVTALSQAAHPSNKYLDGSYYLASDHVSISITSEDNLSGSSVYTEVELTRGRADLPFTRLRVVSDTDPFKAFSFFQIQVQTTLVLYKAILGEEMFERVIKTFQNLSATPVEKWTGNTWALLAINLEYFEYMLTEDK